LLRQQLRPTLLVAFSLVLIHLLIDIANRTGAHAGNLGIYALLLFVPLTGFALTYLPRHLLAVQDIAVVFDVTFTLGILAFGFDPGSTVSAVTVALCLKMLATAVLLPWHPAQQLRSALMTLALYGATLWLSGRHAPETHQIVAPVLAAILATYACRRVDRTHRDLYRHSAELEASERQLRSALAQDRVLLGVANATNVLTDLRSVLERLNRATAEASGAAFSTTFLVRESDDSLELASNHSFEGSLTHAVGTRFPQWSGSNLQRTMSAGLTVNVDDIRKQDLIPVPLLAAAGVQVIAFCPIVNHGRLLGVLTAGRMKGSPGFTDREAAVLTGIAAHAAVTISNARLYDELTASEAAYRDLFERANDLIFVADVDGAIHFANQAALAFFDTTPADLQKLRWTRFLGATDVDRIRRRSKIANRVVEHGADAFEVPIVRPRRGAAILEVRARLISPPGQSPERYQCVARDVTERSRRDEETRALLTRLQETQQLQDEFVANMSHELRTPLNVIIGYADLLADDLHMPLHSDARSFLDRIGAASRALHRMVESILEYARLNRGRMMVIPTNFSSDHLLLELEGLCNDVRSTFAVKLELTQSGTIEFVTDYDRLYSILSNLMLNALKFTPKGKISLSLVRDGEEAVFRVRDTGIGIAPSELRSVFEPFRQVDGSDTRTFGGVGLGLAIVRRNVDLLQGSIDVDSTPEKGTQFQIRIPITIAGAIPHRTSSAA
jgi:PAS domain S-box-containing protein